MNKSNTEKSAINITSTDKKNMLISRNGEPKNQITAKEVIGPIYNTGIKTEREKTKEILKKVGEKDLAYLREESEVLQKLQKRAIKLYDIAESKRDRLTSATSVIVGEPISKKEMKGKFGNKREDHIIEYILANDEYITAKDKIYKTQKKMSTYIHCEIFIDYDYRPFAWEEVNMVSKVKYILVKRYIQLNTIRILAASMEINRMTFYENYEKILN